MKTSSSLLPAALACATLLCVGCTSVRTVPTSSLTSPHPMVRLGDKVTCTLQDGTRTSFNVTAIEPTALVGDQQRVAVADIQQIEMEKVDVTKTLKKTGMAVVYTVGVTVLLVGYAGMGFALH